MKSLRYLCGLVLMATLVVGCREDEGGIKVAELAFEGNQAFEDGELRDVIVTEAKGILPWARARYFNREVFDADLQRLRAFYIDRGYPSASVEGLDVTFNDRRDAVTIRIRINEGPPRLVERVELGGTEGVPAPVVEAVRNTLVAPGRPLDRPLVARSREQAAFALKDRGYPDARVELTEAEGSTPDSRVLTFTARPGHEATFGAVSAVGLSAVDVSVVRRTLAFRMGDLYRESQLIDSQRRLMTLGVFQFAHVVRPQDTANRPDATSVQQVLPIGRLSPAPGAVPINVTVAEGKPTRLRLGIGYGTDDGPRGSLNWQHANFLGSARKLSADAKYSFRERGLWLDLLQPYVINRWLSLRGRAGATWTNELDYSARRIGGRVALEFRTHKSRGLDREPVEHVIRTAYVNEDLAYSIAPETLEDVTQWDELIALGFNPLTGSGSGQVASIVVDLERTVVDRVMDPQTGYALTGRFEWASPKLGGTYRFADLLTDARGYRPVGGVVLAGRVRVGALLANDDIDVPFSSRYFLGGSTSLRGWGRFQVAPLTVDGLPIGGRSLFEAIVEARLPLTEKFGAVLFTDLGNVWADRSDISLNDLRSAVGGGIRWGSPVGIVRADLGYQLTPIDGLVLDGAPEKRQWRVHFSIGEAF